MSELVVEQGKSGVWWRMTYHGMVEYVEHEPTEAERGAFVRSCVEASARRRAQADVPRTPSQSYGSGVKVVAQ
jgi:hypothetical protein